MIHMLIPSSIRPGKSKVQLLLCSPAVVWGGWVPEKSDCGAKFYLLRWVLNYEGLSRAKVYKGPDGCAATIGRKLRSREALGCMPKSSPSTKNSSFHVLSTIPKPYINPL